MEEKNDQLGAKMNQAERAKKLTDKKNTFTFIYILVGIVVIILLGILLFAWITSM